MHGQALSHHFRAEIYVGLGLIHTGIIIITNNKTDTQPSCLCLTHANIRQNIAIALGLKGIFLVTTLLGITGLWLAVLADTGATVLVTANALRLLRKG